jgi:8-oxo-dGTP pyrophosphatase MutT (NUDIX family)
MESLIRERPGVFDRTDRVGHFTASAFILNPQKDKALLMHHRKLGIWVQLGGHAEGSADLLGEAQREAQEESGIQEIVPLSAEIFDLDIHRIPDFGGVLAHDHYDVCFLFQAGREDWVGNGESLELGWFPKEPLPRVGEGRLWRMWDKWRQMA